MWSMNDRSQLRTTSDWTPRQSAADVAATETWGNSPGSKVGNVGPPPPIPARYRVDRLLGVGGFGQVYLAVDEQLKRQVVLKVPHAAGVRQAELEAALAEARVVAQLDHPAIVKVFDFAQTGDGRSFLVCQYIAGSNLAERIARGRIDWRDAAAIAATIARALNFAHQQGVVHRDIKPANILLDQAGTPFVADFGLALTHERLGTGSGSAGTPHYMSPEQASGDGHLVSGSSDIFSLGVVLYEMLTGRKPFPAQTVEETRDLVRRAQPWSPRQLDPQIPVELERICLQALAKDADARFATAGDLAAALDRFLVSVPIIVAPPVVHLPQVSSAGQPTRRNAAGRLAAAIIAASFVGLVLLVAALIFSNRNLSERPNIARKSPAGRKLPESLPPEDAGSSAPTGVPAVIDSPAAAPVAATPPATVPAVPPQSPTPSEPAPLAVPPPFDPSSFAGLPTSDQPPRPRPRPPNFARFGLGGEPAVPEPPLVADARPEFSLAGHTGPVRCVAFAGAGGLLATGGDDQSVRLWDAKTGADRGVLRGYPAAVRCVALTADGRYVAFGGDGFGEQRVVAWDTANKTESARLTWSEDVSPSRVHGLAFSADGKLLAAASTGPVRVWDWQSKTERHVFTWQETYPSYAYGVVFNPDGTRLAAGCHGGGSLERQDTVRLFDLAKNEPADILVSPSKSMGLSHSDVQGAIAFSGDGKRLVRVSQASGGRIASLADRGNVASWNLAAPAAPDAHDLPLGKAFALHISEDGALTVASAAGGEDQFRSSPFDDPVAPSQVALWRAAGAIAFETGHGGHVATVALSRDGQWLATGGDDSTAKVWRVAKLFEGK
jgi:serine/threonine protein kinase/WD40 repeat protein